MMQPQHPNLVLVNDFFKAYASYNLEEVRNILSPEIEWFIPGVHHLSGVKYGPDEVLGYLKEIGKFDFQARPIVLGVNDEYVIDCHLNWGSDSNGDKVEFMSCLLWKIEGGKISKVYNFPQDQHVIDSFFERNQ